ncbi:MAG: alkaline phosphatase D family protein [Planctomycetota bacterium]
MSLARLLALLGLLAVSVPCQTHTHGDAVGPLGPDSVIVWTRASGVADVSVLYGMLPDLSDAVESPVVRVAATDDFVAKVTLGGLVEDSVYYYQTRITDPNNANNFELGPIGRFMTPPSPDARRVVRFAWSADVDMTGNDLCTSILRANPEFFLSLGDMPYADGANTLAQFWDKHKLLRADPTLQDFFRKVGMLAVWDDHEVIDDWDARVTGPFVQNGMSAWRTYLPVVEQRDIYRRVRWGRDLELFLLDARSYRGSNPAPDVATKTMLGSAQLQWLLNGLSTSTATFKLVCSSVPLRHGTAGTGLTGNDHWDGYQRERESILRHVLDNRITGVVWICADQHWAAVHQHPEGIREYLAGPLSKDTRVPPTRAEPELRWLSAERSFGLVAVTPGTPDPVLTVQLYGEHGLLIADAVEAKPLAAYTVETGNPEVGWRLRGSHVYRGAGSRVDLEARPPGNFSVDFVPGARARWRPRPLRFGVGGDEHVFVAGRGQEVPDNAHLALYTDSFDTQQIAASYQVTDETTLNGPSAWFTSGSHLYQSSDIGTFPFDPLLPQKPGTFARFGDTQWTDYTVHVRVRSRDDDNFGVFFRFQGASDFYRFVMNREFGLARIEKSVGGNLTILAEDRTFRYEPLAWYDLTVVCSGSRLRAYVDGDLLLDVVDSAIANGNCALYTWANLVTEFDDLWVRSGDAVAAGVEPLLHDGFNDQVLTGWQILDLGTNEGPSDWRQQEGLLRQLSNVWGGAAGAQDVAKPGTVALTGQGTWDDYWFGASFRSPDDDAVGLVFRWQDADNHYRLSWDHERSYRRLAKVVQGRWTVLWEDTVPFTRGLWHHLAVEAKGSRLRAYVDGSELCEVQDTSLTQGQVGLYAWENQAVEFDDVLVRPPYVDVASFAGRSQVGRLDLIGQAPQGIGGAYVIAMSMTRSTGIPLSILNPADPRSLPLDFDPLFTATLNPFPGLNGFRGTVAADGSLQASVTLPNSTSLRGARVFLGGFVVSLTELRVKDVLPSVQLTFP